MKINVRKATLLVLSVALLLRMAAAVAWHQTTNEQNSYFRLGDSLSYWVLAEHIANSEPYQYGGPDASIFRAPLFPVFLAPFTQLPCSNSLQVLCARLACAAFGTLAVALLMRFASNLGGNCAAIATGAVGAVYPSAIGMSITVLSEALFMPLMILNLLLMQKAMGAEKRGDAHGFAVASGFVAGLTILTRPSWLLFIPFAFGFMLLFGPNRNRQLTLGLVTVLAIGLTMSPWWLRNYRITGQFVPTTLQVGLSLYDGFHQEATGGSDTGMAFSKRLQEEQRQADLVAASDGKQLQSTFEYRVDKRAKSQAIALATENPARTLSLAGRKWMRTWALWPNGGDIGSPLVRILITFSCFSVLSFAILATFSHWQLLRRATQTNPTNSSTSLSVLAKESNPGSYLLCWLPCIYFTLLHMVFVGSIRYREPAMLILCVLAGIALANRAGCYAPRKN
ncbi:MAG: glycosyltransferase family 39 protein [Planctomycetota bacterium]